MQVVDWISKQAGKLADNFQNYKFFVKSTPDHIDSSTRLFLNTFTSRQEEAIVPCLYKWTRLKNGIESEVVEFKGNTFICQPSDVGCILQVQITSTDQQHPGVALLKYGPVQIDVLLKQTIQNALSTGEARFQIDVFHEDRTKQCTLTITDDFMRVVSCNSNASFKFSYCLGEPLVNALTKDMTNIAIVFPHKYESETIKFLLDLWSDISLTQQQKSKQELTVNMKFLNRRNKDEFLFVLKGFIAKKELKHSSIITKIQKLQVDHSNINFILQIQSLRKDLLRLFNLNKKAQQQKKIYFEQTLKLQHQIQDIISSYTKLIEGKFKTRQQFQQSFVDFQNKKDHAIAGKYKRIQQQNLRLKQYIRERLDTDFKDVSVQQFQSLQARTDSLNPFTKKKQPFAEIQLKQNRIQYQNILNNLEGEDEDLLDDTKNYNNVIAQKYKLQQKLNRSMMKIQKLQGELDRLNRSSYSNDGNLSMSKNNTSALQISANKVVEEKYVIQKKYARIKQDYAKLKSAYENMKNMSQSQGQNSSMPESKLRMTLIALENEKNSWKEKAEFLDGQLRRVKEQYQKTKSKLQRRIFQLGQEVNLSRKNSDVLNRSQHLSMEMDEYNQQQTQILKEQNSFLLSQNQRLTKMCEKYKSEYKKMKQGLKNGSVLL